MAQAVMWADGYCIQSRYDGQCRSAYLTGGHEQVPVISFILLQAYLQNPVFQGESEDGFPETRIAAHGSYDCIYPFINVAAIHRSFAHDEDRDSIQQCSHGSIHNTPLGSKLNLPTDGEDFVKVAGCDTRSVSQRFVGTNLGAEAHAIRMNQQPLSLSAFRSSSFPRKGSE